MGTGWRMGYRTENGYRAENGVPDGEYNGYLTENGYRVENGVPDGEYNGYLTENGYRVKNGVPGGVRVPGGERVPERPLVTVGVWCGRKVFVGDLDLGPPQGYPLFSAQLHCTRIKQ
uniref:Uncharacterized protein n=1 Tax=Branchiostoma floridae TaxID=7739 RepID=C3YN26_BRAFL|eukprot:XP_002602120.1 hypothetical protein BRAFLDRAFT_97934 [Branchiostoma floridae]